MVVLLDLDDEDASSPHVSHAPGLVNVKPIHHSLAWTAAEGGACVQSVEERPNPNINGFSAALSCYPIVRQLASQLDLNTLHHLSRTCRQFRANLLDYRGQLVKHTLHCANEDADLDTKRGPRQRNARPSSDATRKLTSGRVGKCARDMVGDCQRCGVVVCRNCTMKPPPTPALRARHRRLCRTCNKAPLALHLAVQQPPVPSSGSSSPPETPPAPRTNPLDSASPRAFTAPAFERTPCNCDNVIWLCTSCAKDMKNADVTYVRAWSWRTRYCHYLGGVGTGAGEGNEGVECGKGRTCLGARIVEHETCEQEILDALQGTQPSTSPERWRGTSYYAQEIEGIGGVLKVKHKKQVRIGECVKMYEDEREKSIQYLEREVTGKLRSWCSWCERVVLGEKDKGQLAGQRPQSSGSSSISSHNSGPSYRY